MRRVNASRKTAASPSNIEVEEIGLREHNKLDKLERIKVAARELFSEKGFDAATTRDIAKRARVAMGTLFNYADDKRDLVFLVTSDGLRAAIDQGHASLDFDRPLLDQLVGVFEQLYFFLSEDTTISRLLLRELTFYRSGKLAEGFNSTRHRIIETITEIVGHAQKEGKVRANHDVSSVARCIFFIYSGAVRWWIAEETPDPQSGLNDLRQLLVPYLLGLAAKPGKS